jgi:hypothetical protein
VSAQGVFGRTVALVNRAVYWLIHRPEGVSFRAFVRQVDPSVDRNELRRIRRQAEIGRETAATATTLNLAEAGFDPRTRLPLPGGAARPGQTSTLREALGAHRAPAGAVRAWVRYEVVTNTGARENRSVVLGGPDDPGGQVTWDTTLEEIRNRAEEHESRQDRPSRPGAIDWSTAEFIPPLRYPPNP